MDKLTKSLIAVAVVAAAGFVFYSGYEVGNNEVADDVVLGGAPDANVLTGLTASSTTVSTGDNLVLATSTARAYVRITNGSGNPVFLNYANNAAQGTGIVLSPSSTLEISAPNLVIDAIHAISAGTGPLYIMFKQ